MPRYRLSLLTGAIAVLAACSDQPTDTALQPSDADASRSDAGAAFIAHNEAHGKKIPDQYIVVLHDGATPADVVARHGAQPLFTYSAALNGFAAKLNQGQVQRLLHDKDVKYVEEDGVVSVAQEGPALPGTPSADGPMVATTQAPATWGIDRTDEPTLPLSNSYTYTNTGFGVKVYVIDTGIRYTHVEFDGITLNRAKKGIDIVTPGGTANDCNGHGTHVAGTVGGWTYGIAKRSTLYAVRVLDCGGSGSWSGVIAGVDWVTYNHVKPAVANMSIQGGLNTAVNDAISRSISYGVTYVVAAGNFNVDACSISPAATPNAITVAASDIADTKAGFSDWGPCVDLYAPGVSITSAWKDFDTQLNTISGTSMASPHVAGMAALFLEAEKTATPAQVTQVILDDASVGLIGGNPAGTPNRLASRYNGVLSGTGSFQYHPWGGSFNSNVDGYHVGWERGTPGTNFNLRLWRWRSATGWVVVATKATAATNEKLTYKSDGNDGSIATWYLWEVYSGSGGGSYDLFTERP